MLLRSSFGAAAVASALAFGSFEAAAQEPPPPAPQPPAGWQQQPPPGGQPPPGWQQQPPPGWQQQPPAGWQQQPPGATQPGPQPPPGWQPPPGSQPPPGWQQQPPPGWQPPPQPAWGPPPATRPSPGEGALRRPETVEEYARTRRELKEALKKAERADRENEADGLRKDLDTLDDWYREDVKRQSTGAFVGGILMTSFGGLSLVTGLGLVIAAQATDASNADRDVVRGLDVASTITLISGVGLLGGGIPLMIYGGEKVMARDQASAPAGRLVVGGGALRLEGSF